MSFWVAYMNLNRKTFHFPGILMCQELTLISEPTFKMGKISFIPLCFMKNDLSQLLQIG